MPPAFQAICVTDNGEVQYNVGGKRKTLYGKFQSHFRRFQPFLRQEENICSSNEQENTFLL